MRVNLGRADRGMSQHLLYGQQVGATFQQMRGKTMPEGVRTDGLLYVIFLRQIFHYEEYHLSCQSAASFVEKYRIGEFRFHVDMDAFSFDVIEENPQA